MKVFEYNNNEYSNFEHPEDLKRIYEYLDDIGTLNISLYRLNNYYIEYSKLNKAEWLLVEDNTLEDFAEWLNKKEI